MQSKVVEQSSYTMSLTAVLNDQDSRPNCGHKLRPTCVPFIYYYMSNSWNGYKFVFGNML